MFMLLNELSYFYKNKRVLVTGSSGFKGSWLSLVLNSFGAKVLGYSLKPNTKPSMYEELRVYEKIENVYGDLLDIENLNRVFNEFKPQIVFHLGAQALVRISYEEPLTTYKTNVLGTLNALYSANKCDSVLAFVNVTSDKCYENIEKNYAYKESDILGGHDMYSSSKACSEILSKSFRASFLRSDSSFGLATARAGNVIGGGDWSEDRLIPDCIRSINSDNEIEIRNPNSVRPWQHVLEPIAGYLTLGAMLYGDKLKFSKSYNFGPLNKDVMSVYDVASKVVESYGKGIITVNKKDSLHEANLLMLDSDKAQIELGIKPKYNILEAIEKTVDWYKKFYSSFDMLDFTLKQIGEYFN